MLAAKYITREALEQRYAIAMEALLAVRNLVGEEDLPDNGEFSGAAICDLVRDLTKDL
jgi:hypothetical protein